MVVPATAAIAARGDGADCRWHSRLARSKQRRDRQLRSAATTPRRWPSRPAGAQCCSTLLSIRRATLVRYVGEITAWHSDERFHFRAEFIDELKAISPPALTHPSRYFAIIAKGDEVLSWEEMSARYRGCDVKLTRRQRPCDQRFRSALARRRRFPRPARRRVNQLQ